MSEPGTFGPGGDAPHAEPLEYARPAEAPPPVQDAPRWAYAVGNVLRAVAGVVFLLGLVGALAASLWLGAYLWGYHVKWIPLTYCTGLGLALYSISQHYASRSRRYAAVAVAEALAAKLRKKSQ